MAMRVAIGAGRARLVRQVLTESLLLAVVGSIVSVLFASVLLRGLRTFLVAALARGSEVQMNWTALAAALAAAVLTSLLASLYPALRMAGADPNRALKEGGRGGASRAQNRLRASFIVGQVALTLVLLIVSGLLLRVVTQYRHTDLGFDPQHILSTSINLMPARYAHRDVIENFYRPLEERVRQIPGVRAAGVITVLPIDNYGNNSELHVAGQPPYPRGQERLAEIRIVSSGYFDAMGIQLHRGRWLMTATDGPENKAMPIIVNEAFVRMFLPQGLDPVTQKVDSFQPWSPIVGVTSSVRQNIYEKPLAEVDYLADSLPVQERMSNMQSMFLVVRFEGDGKALTPALRAAIHEIDPTVPFKAPERMDEVIGEALSMDRMESWLFGIFAGMALLLALVGLYGLISHEVEQGRREIGIRMALGALRGRVLTMVMRRVAVLLGMGAVLGLALTVAVHKLIGMVIYIDAQRQAGVFVGIALLLVVAGLLVALAPGLRAASVDPNEALRSE
jgi:predicted permease